MDEKQAEAPNPRQVFELRRAQVMAQLANEVTSLRRLETEVSRRKSSIEALHTDMDALDKALSLL